MLIIANVSARFLNSIISKIMLGWLNRLGGAIFGLLIGAIFMGALLATIVKLFDTGLVTESFLAGIMVDKLPLVLGLLPGEFDSVRDFFR